MTRQAKTSFTAGELAPELLGRADLRAYQNGARRLRNVFILPTGGVSRRPGLRHLAGIPSPARLVAFEFSTEQAYLLVLTAGGFRVFLGDALVAQGAAPWTAAMLPNLGFTQSADTLLLCHPDMPPHRMTRSSHTVWTVSPFPWTGMPEHRFADPDVALSPGAASGTVNLAATAGVFHPLHVGVRMSLRGVRGTVTGVITPFLATIALDAALPDTSATRDWAEAAFGNLRGWPATCCFHQDRLVLGGSRDLPNRLWLSRSGDLYNFDPGRGLDDEGIAFGLVSDQVNAIRAVFSGRHLQVFTTGGEWMVSGDPLTPASIQLNRQTRIGSLTARMVPPVDVDGTTIFAARSGRAMHEFAYTDVQQAYQSNDLGLVASHLIRDPASMAYDQSRRLLHIVMGDGGMATLTLFRAEQVTAWTRQETQGVFRAVAEVDGRVFCAVERGGTLRLERLDDALALDAAMTGADAVTPRESWSGLAHLEGREVGVLADGAPRAAATVSLGAVGLEGGGASVVQIGLAFAHEVEPLPPELTLPGGTSRAAPLRLVAVTFRLLGTSALDVDLGRGPRPVAFRRLDAALLDAPPAPFSGDLRLAALGWRRQAMQPLWRIAGDAPLPFTLLSATTDTRMTD